VRGLAALPLTGQRVRLLSKRNALARSDFK